MKKVIDLSIGKMNFSLEEDAYKMLDHYLKSFEKTIENESERTEVMQDVESRVAEIFFKEQEFKNQVINTQKVRTVIQHLGEIEIPDDNSQQTESDYIAGKKKLYRDKNGKMLGGICSGLSVYLDTDPTIVRIIFVLLAACTGVGIITYLILWAIIPEATTIGQHLELRGYATTAENIRRFKLENKTI